MVGLELLSRLHRHADQRASIPAYRSDHGEITWLQLDQAVWHVAGMLAANMAAGTTVLISSPNRPEVAIVLLAALAAGLRAFPVSPELADEELRRIAAQSHSAAIVGTSRAVTALHDLVQHRWPIDELEVPALPFSTNPPPIDRLPGDLLLQSSGTTGFPRIVCRKGASLDAVAAAIAESVGFQQGDQVLAMLPLSHSYGVEHGLLAPIWAGSTVLLGHGLDVHRITRELANGATVFPTVPCVIEMLADLPGPARAAPELRRIYSAGSPLPLAVCDRFHARHGRRVSQLYGATEVGSVTFNSPEAQEFDPASVGRPMDGVSLRILSTSNVRKILPAGCEGEVAIRARSMMSGYLDGASPLEDGHFLTGDLGLVDAVGGLTITGRLKLLIDVGGIKVNPIEIESVLREHPAVGACVVVPVRQSETVFRSKAIVTPRDPGSPPTIEELRSFARKRLATYKVPRVFELRSSLPVTATGKVLRHLVEN